MPIQQPLCVTESSSACVRCESAALIGSSPLTGRWAARVQVPGFAPRREWSRRWNPSRLARTAGRGGSLAGNPLRCKHDAESSSRLGRDGGRPWLLQPGEGAVPDEARETLGRTGSAMTPDRRSPSKQQSSELAPALLGLSSRGSLVPSERGAAALPALQKTASQPVSRFGGREQASGGFSERSSTAC